MTRLSEAAIHELTWRFPKRENQAFELYAAEQEFGWLRFDDAAGVRATGELNGRQWIFQHSDGPHPHVRIFLADGVTPVGEYLPRLAGGGSVVFANGARYCWNRAKIWSKQWCFRKEGEGSSICLSQHSGPLAEGGKVNVCGKAAQVPETAVLVLLAWYLRVLDFETLVEKIPSVG
jgi:hypothetical protein